MAPTLSQATTQSPLPPVLPLPAEVTVVQLLPFLVGATLVL